MEYRSSEKDNRFTKDVGPNYIRLSCYNPFKFAYVYVDKSFYQADSIFIKNKMHVSFQDTFVKNDIDCVIVFVKIKKKNQDVFIRCMKTLYRQFSNDPSYNQICDYLNQLASFDDKQNFEAITVTPVNDTNSTSISAFLF